jgi:hypothetical protein
MPNPEEAVHEVVDTTADRREPTLEEVDIAENELTHHADRLSILTASARIRMMGPTDRFEEAPLTIVQVDAILRRAIRSEQITLQDIANG